MPYDKCSTKSDNVTKRLYLLRHAKAEPGRIDQDDFERPLAPRGLENSKKFGEWLRSNTSITCGENNNITHPACGGGKGGAQIQTIDLVLCSSAVRTRQTLAQVLGATSSRDLIAGSTASIPQVDNVDPVVEPRDDIRYLRELYHAPAEVMLSVLQQTSPDAKTVLMVGHNPGIHQLAASLARHGEEKLVGQVISNYPTCACSIFQFNCKTWQEAGPEHSEIVGLWLPR